MSTADAWQSSGVSSAVPSSCFPLASLQRAPRVERVAQAIADVVDGEHRQKDHPPWEQGPMGRNIEIIAGVGEQAAPGGHIRGEAETQEGERGLRQDGR